MLVPDPNGPSKGNVISHVANIEVEDVSDPKNVVLIGRQVSRGYFDGDQERVSKLLFKLDPNIREHVDLAIQLISRPATRDFYVDQHLRNFSQKVILPSLGFRDESMPYVYEKLNELGIFGEIATRRKIAQLFDTHVSFVPIFVACWNRYNRPNLLHQNLFVKPVSVLTKIRAHECRPGIYDDLILELFARREPDEDRFLKDLLDALAPHIKNGDIELKDSTIEEINTALSFYPSDGYKKIMQIIDVAGIFEGKINPKSVDSASLT